MATQSMATQNPTCARLRVIHSLQSRSVRAFWLSLGEKEPGRDSVGWTDRDGRRHSISYAGLKLYHVNRQPSAPYLARVAEVYAVSLTWLITGAGPMEEVPLHA